MKMNIDKVLLELNSKQRQAVEHKKGPLFVVAGAGTGKTKTLTTRLAYLLSKGYRPESLLAVTFTNKAAKEMKDRVIEIASPAAMLMWVHTFHAFGLRLLRSEVLSLENGLTRDFSVIDDADSNQIVRDIIKETNLDSKQYPGRATRNIISNIKNKQHVEETVEEVYFDLTRKYNQYLLANNLMDFDDLLIHTYTLLSQNEKIRTKYQTKFSNILVDEFQDTNKIQYDIIKILASAHKNVFIVGDPDQSIYSFRGANYTNSQDFIDYFQGEMVVLDENYRSTSSILNVANQLIKNNLSRPVTKNLVSYQNNHGSPVTIREEQSDISETYFIVNEIEKLVKSGYNYGDCAILYRTNVISRIFEETLMRAGINYVIYSGLSFFERKEVKDAIAYLRILMNPHQDFYFKRVINVPRRGIGLTTLDRLETFALSKGISLFEAIGQATLPSAANKNLKDFKEMIIRVQSEIEEMDNPGLIIEAILENSGYIEMLHADGDDGIERLENIRELKSIFLRGSHFYEGTLFDKIKQTLDEIALISDLDQVVDESMSVKLSSIHQVKGLEFKVVFIVALENGIFPNQNNLNSTLELEEERRVCYVAITRAKEQLYLTSAAQRYRFGTLVYHNPSIFIGEIVPKNFGLPKFSPRDKIKTQTISSSSLIADGDTVSHTEFGVGVVVSNSDSILTIAFKLPHGIKRIIEDHPAIKKTK